MFRLHVLGPAFLAGSPHESSPQLISQPKQLALLTYLALCNPRRPPRRDSLLAMFWPELDESSARHALSQALSVLRRDLGPDVMDGKWRDPVRLVAGGLWCDAIAFRDAVRDGHDETALELYGGPLLDGVHIAGAADFGRWLEVERLELARLASRAAGRLLSNAVLERRWTDAAHWSRIAIRIDPYDESAWRQLFAALAANGDRAAALAEFQRLCQHLREDLDTEPAPETLDLVESLRSRPPIEHDVVAAPSSTAPPADSPDPQDTANTHPESAPPHFRAPSFSGPLRGRIARRVVALALAITALTLAGVLATTRHEPPPPAASSLLAIFPFRVHGADSALAWLGEGVADLAETRLAAEASVQVIGMPSTTGAWRRAVAGGERAITEATARRIADQLGADRLMLGSVVGTSGNVTLSAAIVETAGDRVLGRATATGSIDSLTALVGLLVAQLLSLEAGEERDRLTSLTSTSLPALRAYLDGTAALRRGQADLAIRQFEQALDADSSFALAALGLHRSLGYGYTRHTPDLAARARRLAWAHHGSLPPRDRLLLRARIGSRYPAWTPVHEQVAFLDSAAAAHPGVAGLWFELGNALFDHGAHLELDDWRRRAGDALRRALELDPGYFMARVLLYEMLIEAGDSSGLRALRAGHSGPALRPRAAEWFAATTFAGGGMAAPPSGFESWPEQELRRVIIGALSFGVGLAAADRAVDILLARARNQTERDRTLLLARELALNSGRTAEVTRILAELRGPGRPEWYRRERLRDYLYYALYWDGERAAAAAVADELVRHMTVPAVAGEQEVREQLRDLCVLEQWRLADGERATVASTIERLRYTAASLPDRAEAARAESCAAMLQAMAAAYEAPGDLPLLVQTFEAAHRVALPPGNEALWYCAGNLVAARLHEQAGNDHAALRALRRHGEPGDRKILLSTVLREEARLTAALGDTVTARRLQRHYRALREPRPATSFQ